MRRFVWDGWPLTPPAPPSGADRRAVPGFRPDGGVKGWKLLLELDGSNNVVRKYTWGLDLAGQSGGQTSGLSAGLEGAGGIGGLLAMEDFDSGTTQTGGFLYFYDAGGNVGQVVDTDNDNIEVKYEYDPYGRRTNTAVGGELEQPFRFSTKFFDAESGLHYFGYRYSTLGVSKAVTPGIAKQRTRRIGPRKNARSFSRRGASRSP